MKRPLLTSRRLIAMGIAVLFAVLSYFLFDRPIATQVGVWFPDASPRAQFFSKITDIGLSDYYLYATAAAAVFSYFVIDRARKLDRSQIPQSPSHPVAFLFHKFRHSPATTRFALAFIAIAGSGLVTDLIKVVVGRQRPWLLDHGQYGFVPFTASYDTNSMPSGHATVCGAVVTLLCIYFPRFRFFWIPLMIFGASTRILTQSHYLSDTVVGFTLGSLFTLILLDLAHNQKWPADVQSPPIAQGTSSSPGQT